MAKTMAKTMATVTTATMMTETKTNGNGKDDGDSDASEVRDNDGIHDDGGYNDNNAVCCGGEGGLGSSWDQNAEKLSSLAHRRRCPSSLHP
jgi:hypothetical protein